MSTYGASTVKRRRRSNAELASVDEAIVAAVAEEYPVTLRGVYYRVVSAGAVDKTEAGYRLVGRQLLKLRRAGVVPYSAITDGTRYVIHPRRYADPQAALDEVAASYRKQLWRDQQAEVHVFVEKDAISGVVEPVTEQWDVPLGVLRGYASETFVHSVAEAVRECGKRAVFMYQLGDHDPSGVDAWRAFHQTVAGFLGDPVTPEMAAHIARTGAARRPAVGSALGVQEMDPPDSFAGDICEQVTYGFLGGPGFEPLRLRTVTFARLAVTEDQVDEWRLPTRPTKHSDSRAAGFTGGSVEVDAIRPSILRQLVEDAITSHIDPHSIALHRQVEAQERAGLEALAGRWSA